VLQPPSRCAPATFCSVLVCQDIRNSALGFACIFCRKLYMHSIARARARCGSASHNLGRRPSIATCRSDRQPASCISTFSFLLVPLHRRPLSISRTPLRHRCRVTLHHVGLASTSAQIRPLERRCVCRKPPHSDDLLISRHDINGTVVNKYACSLLKH